jgi:LPXTG-site transpeptidase (sortase) family protein
MNEGRSARSRTTDRRVAIFLSGLGVVAVLALALGVSGLGGAAPPSAPVPGPSGVLADVSLVPVVESETASASNETGPSQPAETAATTQGVSSPGSGTRAKRIRIDRLGIDLRIVDGDGIDAPLGKAAHYPGSAWPRQGSNIYIYAHAQEGMFINLWDAREGDVVELDLIDGTSVNYVVDEVLPKVAWNSVELLKATTNEQLTLQTSTSYQPTAPRFVVIAHPAS